MGAKRGRTGPATDAARVHRRLQQHERLQAGLRLRRRVGRRTCPTARRSWSGATCRCSATSKTADGRHRPNTILVDSQQLESGEGMSAEFKRIAEPQIEEFKAEYRDRFPGRDAEGLTDEDLLREVMNTVGKAGKLGEHIRCVVSVSMLTEGWDANTVTHILGVRAFGTQLLVRAGHRPRAAADELRRQRRRDVRPGIRRRLRRAVLVSALLGHNQDHSSPARLPTRVRAFRDGSPARSPGPGSWAIVTSCPASSSTQRSTPIPTRLDNADIPTKTEIEGIVGEIRVDTLDDLKDRRSTRSPSCSPS